MKIEECTIEAAREPAITRRSHLVIAILLVTFLLKKSINKNNLISFGLIQKKQKIKADEKQQPFPATPAEK
jgi:hypothetical protein